MANVINRTTLQYLKSVNTPNYPTAAWIINPTLPQIAPKYWKISGDDVLEMSQAEKDAVDAAEATARIAAKEAQLKNVLFADPLSGLSTNVVIDGLEITVDIVDLITDDVTNVIADVTDTKYVLVSLIYVETTDTFAIDVVEKTTGEYADLAADETLVGELGEYSVVANGDTLVEV
jgi:hypothetical protein